jgi:hypothetical protein
MADHSYNAEEIEAVHQRIAALFATGSYLPIAAKLFSESQMRRHLSVQSMYCQQVFDLAGELPIAAFGEGRGSSHFFIKKHINSPIFTLKSAIAPAYQDYVSLQEEGLWDETFTKGGLRAFKAHLAIQDSVILGSTTGPLLRDASAYELHNDNGLFSPEQSGVQHLGNLEVNSFEQGVQALASIVHAVKNASPEFEVTAVAIDDQLYSGLASMVSFGESVIERAQKVAGLTFTRMRGLEGRVLAYDHSSDHHHLLLGLPPHFSAITESTALDGAQYFRAHILSGVGGNVFLEDNVFAEAKIVLAGEEKIPGKGKAKS